MNRAELIALAGRLAAPYRILPPGPPGGGPLGAFAGNLDGQSVDFHDFREYQQGDDLRRVDWRAYARSGQMHLKLFREEVSPVVELLLDTSASLAVYPGKEETAVFLAAFLRGVTLASEGRPVLCRDGARFAGGDFDAALLATRFAGDATAALVPARGSGARPLRVFLSDFLFPAGLGTLFRDHASGSLYFTPIMLLARSEIDPPWRGHLRLHDVEAPAATLDLSLTDDIVDAYRARLRKHEDALAAEARRHGGRLLRIDCPDGPLTRDDCEALALRLATERVVTTR